MQAGFRGCGALPSANLSAPCTCRPIFGIDDEAQREVRISCPDATGLGCDVTRMLLDFGLKVLHGDMTTDGRWCFLIFKAGPSAWCTASRQQMLQLSTHQPSTCMLQVSEAGCLPRHPQACLVPASSQHQMPRLAGDYCGPLASPCMPTALP